MILEVLFVWVYVSHEQRKPVNIADTRLQAIGGAGIDLSQSHDRTESLTGMQYGTVSRVSEIVHTASEG